MKVHNAQKQVEGEIGALRTISNILIFLVILSRHTLAK